LYWEHGPMRLPRHRCWDEFCRRMETLPEDHLRHSIMFQFLDSMGSVGAGIYDRSELKDYSPLLALLSD
jgi:hypothetical protein